MLDVCEATLNARDLVNEPASHLSAVQLSEAAQKLAKSCGFTAKVMNKKQIEAEKMGGLLAVNQGSIDPPVFIVMEWKPKNAVNKKPCLLYTSDAADERSSVDLGGRRIIKKKKETR